MSGADMGKSGGQVKPCHECGSKMVKYDYAVYDTYECKNQACGMIGKFRDLRNHNKPIHPTRLAAEGLVPVSSLAPLVKALEEIRDCSNKHEREYDIAEAAIAEARKREP